MNWRPTEPETKLLRPVALNTAPVTPRNVGPVPGLQIGIDTSMDEQTPLPKAVAPELHKLKRSLLLHLQSRQTPATAADSGTQS